MDYMCRLGSLGNLSTTSGCSDPGRTVGTSYSLAVGIYFFVPAVLLSIFSLLCLLSSSVSLSYFNITLPMRKWSGVY